MYKEFKKNRGIHKVNYSAIKPQTATIFGK